VNEIDIINIEGVDLLLFDGFIIPPVAGLRCLPVRCTCLRASHRQALERRFLPSRLRPTLSTPQSHGIRDALNLNFLLSITLMTFYEFIIV
jgi:hypothetical protein